MDCKCLDNSTLTGDMCVCQDHQRWCCLFTYTTFGNPDKSEMTKHEEDNSNGHFGYDPITKEACCGISCPANS